MTKNIEQWAALNHPECACPVCGLTTIGKAWKMGIHNWVFCSQECATIARNKCQPEEIIRPTIKVVGNLKEYTE